jgi:hypothetical protein
LHVDTAFTDLIQDTVNTSIFQFTRGEKRADAGPEIKGKAKCFLICNTIRNGSKFTHPVTIFHTNWTRLNDFPHSMVAMRALFKLRNCKVFDKGKHRFQNGVLRAFERTREWLKAYTD